MCQLELQCASVDLLWALNHKYFNEENNVPYMSTYGMKFHFEELQQIDLTYLWNVKFYIVTVIVIAVSWWYGDGIGNV